MNDLDVNSKHTRVVDTTTIYHYKGRVFNAIGWFVFAGAMTAAGAHIFIFASSWEAYLGAKCIVVVLAAGLYFLAALGLIGSSLVIVDTVGLKRTFHGWVWANMPWEAITSITVQSIVSPYNKPMCRILIRSTGMSGTHRCSKIIKLSDRVEEYAAMARQINAKVEALRIPVWFQSATGKSQLDAVPLSTPYRP